MKHIVFQMYHFVLQFFYRGFHLYLFFEKHLRILSQRFFEEILNTINFFVDFYIEASLFFIENSLFFIEFFLLFVETFLFSYKSD